MQITQSPADRIILPLAEGSALHPPSPSSGHRGEGAARRRERGRRYRILMRRRPRRRMSPSLPLDPAEGSAPLPTITVVH
uniref:Uncharacterized protein n=1 Tax=Oryza sativa subsp. japonica TaxID=39947 RepID=Q6Z161_ORYSJ|nr:hypothetical protein [Oryza sativa Japonica Group]BAD31904.1 hypothetical protein [Oryza sativa Japonica Group]